MVEAHGSWDNILARIGAFQPEFLIPVVAYPSLILGLFLLCISTFTLTFHGPLSRYIRLLLAPPSLFLFVDFAYGPYPAPTHSVGLALAVVGLYGCMRTIETSFVGFFDESPPKWIIHGKLQPLPVTFSSRIAYAFDLATSLRGNSWFRDTHWDWCPPHLIKPSVPPRTFAKSQLYSLVIQYLVLDVFDTMNKSRAWHVTAPENTRYPITSLPIYLQLPLSLSVCVGTMLAITTQYDLIAAIAVLLGSDAANWPPMFDKPFQASSLSDFWSKKWHSIFRRVFHRLSLSILWAVPKSIHPTLYKTIHAISTFFLSTLLHILLVYRLSFPPHSHSFPIFDHSILWFFLTQPATLLVEFAIVKPLLNTFAGRYASLALRCWAWFALLWTGRYWSDVWVSRHLWTPGDKVVGASLVRGLLYGEWTV